MKNINKKVSIVGILTRMNMDKFKCIPFLASFKCILDIIHASSYVIVIMATQSLFDSVTKVAGGEPISYAILPLIYFGLSGIFLEIINGFANFDSEYPSPKFLAKLNERIFNKASSVGPIRYENPEFLDMVNKAKQGTDTGYFISSFAFDLITFYLPYFIFMGIYLSNLSPLLIFTLLFVFIPVIIGQTIRFTLFSKMEDEIAPTRRKMEHYEKIICDIEFFKETRILGTFNHFLNLYRNSILKVNEKIYSAEMKHVKIDAMLRVLTILGYMGVLSLLIYDLVNGNITVGGFAAVFSSVSMTYSFANSVFGSFMNHVTRNASTIKNYQNFIDFPDETGEIGDFQKEKGIILNNVYFQYPNSSKMALNGVSLEIKEGEVIAIVGENGMGKSTLTKLIMGLYKPTKGQVYSGGLDTLKIKSDSVYKGFSAVFQRFQKYRMTLNDNISISDIEIDNTQMKIKVKEACKKVDLALSKEKYSLQEETMLSREFDGVDLSGGQWQRIAIGRGLYRNHDVIILDEPTAAIDPIEETRVYKQFAEISKDKTSIIVTHRLGAAKIADRIVVMKNGKIEDIGSHDELLARGNSYAHMYSEQAKWYDL